MFSVYIIQVLVQETLQIFQAQKDLFRELGTYISLKGLEEYKLEGQCQASDSRLHIITFLTQISETTNTTQKWGNYIKASLHHRDGKYTRTSNSEAANSCLLQKLLSPALPWKGIILF